MYNSGFVNIESHTLFHSEVFTSKKIVNFITSETEVIPYNFIGSPYFTLNDIGKTPVLNDYIGLPLFKSNPTMFAGPRMNINIEFIKRCKKIYAEHKVDKNRWQIEIKQLAKNSENYFSVEDNSFESTINDLKIARQIIQDKLDENAGNHLCLPWTKGNERTINICKKLNIKSCFWGLLEHKSINKLNDDPYYITRLKNDFIFRLPGKGRKSIISIYYDKLKRRFSGEKVF
jgi:hypothetical protein